MKRVLAFILAPGLGLLILLAGCRPGQPDAGPTAGVVTAMNRGTSLMAQYDYDGAVKAFEAAVKAEPGLADAKVNLAIARFNRARKEDLDIDRSGQLLDEVLIADPNHVRAWYIKGILLQHAGKTEEAVGCFEKVLQQRPQDGVAWYILGTCKQRLGKNCESELLKAIELKPYLGSAYYKLFQALQADGQTEKALPYLNKFKQLRESPLIETVELPQYNQMGELALAYPMPARNTPQVSSATYSLNAVSPAFETGTLSFRSESSLPSTGLGGAVVGMPEPDGSRNLIMPVPAPDGSGSLLMLHCLPDGRFVNRTAGSGLESVLGAATCALGDLDNDGILDLFVTGSGGNLVFRGKTNGTFIDATAQSGMGGLRSSSRSGLLLDADHDGDLDVLVCGTGVSGIQLWNNNADGTFTNIAAAAGIACTNARCSLALAGDLDGDRDSDLVILCDGQAAKVFLNDLLGQFHEADSSGTDIRGELGAVLEDFNADGRLDVLALGGNPVRLQLWLGDGHGRFQAAPGFDSVANSASSWGSPRGFRITDVDLDGDLDIALFCNDLHLLLNDGTGRFVLRPQFLSARMVPGLVAVELFDFDGDGVPDLFGAEQQEKARIQLLHGSLSPPQTALFLSPTGLRERDKRTRSPATPYGLTMTVRAGLREQARVFSGQFGGPNQSPVPLVFGLAGAHQADYAQFRWPDGVSQVETMLAVGKEHKISELERKISSCPVLFAWNGKRFEFITDFAGVGGLGYFIAPGNYAPPQVLEHVKIEPGQLHARGGCYELRVTEPMEETAYVDQLELVAIDHPVDWRVFPDERLAVTGPQPTHQLLVVKEPLFPRLAVDSMGHDCTAQVLKADRVYSYHPILDRRFFGFAQRHSLELDFGDQLEHVPASQRLFLFLTGFLEYPYSQTAYAAGQARVGWEPIRVERFTDGQWQVIVPDAGAFGGMARTMTVDMTGLLTGPRCRLRLSSNLEIYYDQVFVARDVGQNNVQVRRLSLKDAQLSYAGFAREFSPDGGLPLIYDYDLKDATAPFHILRGAYTRYGPVRPLLEAFDDQYVLVGPGDEIALKFDAFDLAAPAEGTARSFILVSHAYCKDMDLYTASPQTLEPLPFHGMSRYPYPSSEHYPDTASIRHYRRVYNTRVVD